MMLYGNIIFIKKTGGDGSKYPVTDKCIKIGRSEECLIRIYNNKVASEHCQLIITDDGQAKLKDLSNQTVLNGNISVSGEVALCHGDIFKVGERLARWEYFPTSKYYKQTSSTDQPTVRLVAVVMPQQRPMDDQSTPGTSTEVLKNTPNGGKRRYSERFASENAQSAKIRKSSCTRKSKDFAKFLMGCHGLKTGKLLMSGSKIKDRKSTSGIINSKTPRNKSRKSTLPSWKVNIVTPPSTSSENSGCSSTKSQRKSSRSTQSIDLYMSNESLENSSPDAKENVKPSLPEGQVLSEPINDLKPLKKSPVKSEESVSFSKSSPRKSTVVSTPSPKPVRKVYSERKRKPSIAKSKDIKRLSLVHQKVDKHNRSLSKSFTRGGSSSPKKKVAAELMKTTGKLETPLKSSVKKVNTPNSKTKTPRLSKSKSKSNVEDKLSTPMAVGMSAQTVLKNKIASSTPVMTIPQKLEKSVGKLKSSRKSLGKRLSSNGGRLNSSVRSSASARSPSQSRASGKKINFSKEKTSPRGVRRELSPSISSAERAAKKLKTSCPKKPDKNKKAALLLLGKANFKHLSQNAKVLLKQKLVKRAIKQSTTANVQKCGKSKKLVPAVKGRPKKTLRKCTSKPSKAKKNGNSPMKLTEVTLQDKMQTANTPKGENAAGETLLGDTKVNEAQPFSSEKSINQFKTESTPADEKISHYEKTAESFLFNSNRRCSKRLSSKNDTGRPDFIELSPTALGLIPKNLDVFKTPKQNKRRSSSLATPKIEDFAGIIKSASTSKIGSRKSVRFSSKDLSTTSELFNSNVSDKTDFEFGVYQTPDVSVDAFVSPLGDKSNVSKKSSRGTFSPGSNSALTKIYLSYSEPRKCVRKLLESPQSKRGSVRGSSAPVSPDSVRDHPQSDSVLKDSQENTPELDLESKTPTISRNSKGPQSSKSSKTPKNSLTDLRGVKKLFTTPKVQKSPKNRLSDLRGVKKLLTTPKAQKSPKNRLSDLRGVKKLLTTPKAQKSPKNRLSDLRGVKKLLTTPKAHKSPKNDLSDLRGVKKLLTTPKVQKDPKNDLSDLRGVKQLLTTPKAQKSPKNDLSDLRGVKKLLTTPKSQKSPKNDLSDVRGVKKLLTTPKIQKSPKNDLSDLRGVKKLLTTPKAQKSPRNDLSDLEGVKKLLTTPKIQKSPKNSLTDLDGVKELLQTPKSESFDVKENSKLEKSIKSDLNTSSSAGMENFVDFLKENFDGPPKIAELSADGVEELLKSAKSWKDASGNLLNEVELQDSKSEPKRKTSRNSRASSFKAIRGRRTIGSNVKSPKNDLSDVAGVRELFSRHKPISDYNVNLTGLAELFDGAEVSTPRAKRTAKASVSEDVQRVRRTLRSLKTKEEETVVDTRERSKRGVALKKPTRKPAVAKKSKTQSKVKEVKTSGRKLTKRQAQPVESSASEKSEQVPRRRTKAASTEKGETKITRKRKAPAEDAVPSPPKLRRKQSASEKSTSRVTKAVTKTTSRSKVAKSTGKTSAKTKKASDEVKGKGSTAPSKVQSKKTKTSSEQSTKVQKRSQRSVRRMSNSEEKINSVKTRNVRGNSVTQKRLKRESTTVENDTSSSAGRRRAPSVVRKSTRRK